MSMRFIMIGGFLGAGKTTTIGKLAQFYIDQGKKVGIVTNDQTTDLVDTHNLRSQGFNVGEVAGSCFCCNFNELTSVVEKVQQVNLPDIILAEPVGSCTDLVATVIRPLKQVYNQPVEVAPYGVILKPSHGLKILRNEAKAGFSPKAAYIFRKQLEEADFILVNRIDELFPETLTELTRLLAEQFPGTPVLTMSAKTGAGLPDLTDHLAQQGLFGTRLMEVDYDIYAEGEAELGWLNGQVAVQGTAEFELDALLLDIVERLRVRLAETAAETAHLKAIGLWEGNYAVANLVSSFTSAELSHPSGSRVPQASVVINARVATDPQMLEQLVRETVAAATAAIGASYTIETMQSFRPGRPVPTHRILETA